MKKISIVFVIIIIAIIVIALSMRKPEKAVFEFDENPTTGFAWSYEISPELQVSESHTVDSTDGSKGTVTFEVVPADNGTHTAKFVYKNKDEELKSYDYEFKVANGVFEKIDGHGKERGKAVSAPKAEIK